MSQSGNLLRFRSRIILRDIMLYWIQICVYNLSVIWHADVFMQGIMLSIL